MSATTRNRCASALTFILLIGSMVLPALAREEVAVLTPGGAALASSPDLVVAGNPAARVGTDNGAGEVNIFVRDGSTWSMQTTLTASDGSAYDNFGAAVALDGDVIAVGAPALDTDFPHVGAAYVFRRQGDGTWVEEEKFASGSTNQWDDFGLSLDLEDGLLVVGDHLTRSVFVFRHDGGSWVDEAELSPVDVEGGDAFSLSLSLDGDCLVVGSPGDDDDEVNAGAAYVFRREGTSWTEEAKLTASDATPQDAFGRAVAISGSWIVVGAPARDGKFTSVGGAYVFEYVGSAWVEHTQIGYPEFDCNGEVGTTVAISGDRLVLGAPAIVVGREMLGGGYLFMYIGDQWYALDQLIPSEPIGGGQIGHALSLNQELCVLGAGVGIPSRVFYIGGDIPTVSEWGMVVLTLLVLTTGTILLRRTKYYQGEESHGPSPVLTFAR